MEVIQMLEHNFFLSNYIYTTHLYFLKEKGLLSKGKF